MLHIQFLPTKVQGFTSALYSQQPVGWQHRSFSTPGWWSCHWPFARPCDIPMKSSRVRYIDLPYTTVYDSMIFSDILSSPSTPPFFFCVWALPIDIRRHHTSSSWSRNLSYIMGLGIYCTGVLDSSPIEVSKQEGKPHHRNHCKPAEIPVNGRQFESKTQALRDFHEWMSWMMSLADKEEACRGERPKRYISQNRTPWRNCEVKRWHQRN